MVVAAAGGVVVVIPGVAAGLVVAMVPNTI